MLQFVRKALSSTWSMRSIFLISLLVFCVVPAATVGWVLYQSNLQTVDLLAEKILGDVSERVQLDTQEHLGQAHIIFNGLLPVRPSVQTTSVPETCCSSQNYSNKLHSP
jgi:hypothetical protein